MEREVPLFINGVPYWFPARNLERQMKIELWLDLTYVAESLGLKALIAATAPSKKETVNTYIS